LKKLLALSILLALTGCSKSGPNTAQYWQSWGDDMLIEWQVKSSVFSINTTSYCQENLELDVLQYSWKELALHWAALNGFPYQAISDNNLEFKLYFWPDKRNMVEQQLSRRTQSDVVFSASDLEATVAAEKGLPAMEWLTFSEDLSQQQRCNVLPVIADDYSRQVDSIVQYHEDNPIIQPEWLDKSYRVESASISLNLTFQQVGHLSNRLRNGFDDEGNLIPILSEGWRSNSTKKIYEASYASIIQHLKTALESLDITVNGQGLLKAQISHMEQVAISLDIAEVIEPSLVKEIHTSLIDMEQLIEGPLAQDTGVLIGFNNYDGD